MKPDTNSRNQIIDFLNEQALSSALNDFLIDRRLQGRRETTLRMYRSEINLFTTWVAEVGARTLSDLTPAVLRAYFLDLRTRRNAYGVHSSYRVLRAWLKWAWAEYDLPGACPITKVQVERPKSEPKPALALAGIERLLDVCRGHDEKRDKAIILFLLDSAVRTRECCMLTIGSLNGDAVHLAGEDTKSGRARDVFLSRPTIQALRAYLRSRQNLTPESPLFESRRGGRFSPSGLYRVIARLWTLAGLPVTGLHAFRRTAALEMLRSGADLVSISRILGHTQLETTKRYLPQELQDLRQVHENTSPVRKLKKGTQNKR